MPSTTISVIECHLTLDRVHHWHAARRWGDTLKKQRKIDKHRADIFTSLWQPCTLPEPDDADDADGFFATAGDAGGAAVGALDPYIEDIPAPIDDYPCEKDDNEGVHDHEGLVMHLRDEHNNPIYDSEDEGEVLSGDGMGGDEELSGEDDSGGDFVIRSRVGRLLQEGAGGKGKGARQEDEMHVRDMETLKQAGVSTQSSAEHVRPCHPFQLPCHAVVHACACGLHMRCSCAVCSACMHGVMLCLACVSVFAGVG